MRMILALLLAMAVQSDDGELLARAAELLLAGDGESALPLCEQALTLRSTQADDARAEAEAYVAWAHYLREDLERARAAEARAQAILDRLAPGQGSAPTTMHLLGLMHQRRADYERAAYWWARAAAGFAQPDGDNHDPRLECWILSDLAEMRRLLGQAAAAESVQTRAVQIARQELPEDAFFATLLNNLGALQWDRGRMGEAELSYREALRISLADASASGSRRATAHLNLGVLLRDQFKFDAATEQLELAAAMSDTAFAPDAEERDMFLLELGKLYEAVDRPRDAIAVWQRALTQLRARRKPHPIYESRIVDDMGRAFLARGDAEAAEQQFERALQLRQSIHAAEHPDIAISTLGLIEARVRQGQSTGLDERLQAAIEILERHVTAPEALARAYGLRAELARQRGRLAEAQREVDRALALLEELRQRRGASSVTRASFLAQHLSLYAMASDIALERRDPWAALAIVESARARVFHEQLQRSRRGSEGGDAHAESERRIAGELAATQRELQLLRRTLDPEQELSELERLEDRRERLLRELRDLEDLRRLERGESRSDEQPTLDRKLLARELLDDDTMLLVYEIGSARSRVYALRAEQLSVHELRVSPALARQFALREGPLRAADLDSLIGASDGALARIERSRGVVGVRRVDAEAPLFTASSHAHALFRLLVPQELWSALENLRACVVVPDGALHRLPFEALVVQDRTPPRYWLDDGPILRYAGSLLSLLEQTRRARERPQSERMLFSLADPSFAQAHPQWELPALPGTRAESERVQAAFARWPVASALGAEATESALRAQSPQARYVHLATHGLVDEGRSELLAALALTAPAQPTPLDDGYLYLHELAALPWNCELAVLSACATQRGRQLGGEGVFALARAAQAAGARRAIASLWAVDDRSTAALIGDCFERIAAAEAAGERPDYAAELRDAKRALRADPRFASPYYWAAFVLSGPH